MKIGFALLYLIAFIGAMKVKVGAITSSPSLTPTIFKLICNAVVPLMQKIACFEPVYFAILCSKVLINFPVVETQVEFIH